MSSRGCDRHRRRQTPSGSTVGKVRGSLCLGGWNRQLPRVDSSGNCSSLTVHGAQAMALGAEVTAAGKGRWTRGYSRREGAKFRQSQSWTGDRGPEVGRERESEWGAQEGGGSGDPPGLRVRPDRDRQEASAGAVVTERGLPGDEAGGGGKRELGCQPALSGGLLGKRRRGRWGRALRPPG